MTSRRRRRTDSALEQLHTAGEQVVAVPARVQQPRAEEDRLGEPAREELRPQRQEAPRPSVPNCATTVRTDMVHELRTRGGLRRALLLHTMLAPPRACHGEAEHPHFAPPPERPIGWAVSSRAMSTRDKGR
jgi:hypothetical protein